MLAPVIAHVLTRKITKEGFAMTGRDSMMLGISFRDRKWIYFVIAVLLPWIYTELGNGITLLLCPDLFDSGYYKTLGVEKGMTFIQPASVTILARIILTYTFITLPISRDTFHLSKDSP